MAPGKKRGRGSSVAAAAAQEWSVGDLVLAKVKGFPAWPAQVSKPEAFGEQHNPARVFVVFFGTKQIRFCHHSEISRFTPEVKASLVAKIHSKSTPADLRLAVTEICDAEKVCSKDGCSDSFVPGLNGFKELIEDGDAVNSQVRNSEDGGVVSGHDEHDEHDENDADQCVDSYENQRTSDSMQTDSCVMDLEGKAVEEQAGNGGTSEIDDYALEWGSATSLDGNSDDENHQTSKGITIHEKVQTNFASHEELDAFDAFEFFNDEVVNTPSYLQVEKKKPAKVDKQVKKRTPTKSKKPAANSAPAFPANFCRKKRKQMTVKSVTPRGMPQKSNNSNENQPTSPGVPSPNESQEFTYRRKVTLKKRLRPMFESNPGETESDKADTSHEASPITQDPDRNLPIVKRARARAAKEAMIERHKDEEEEKHGYSHSRSPTADATPACNGSDSAKTFRADERGTDPKPKLEEKYSGLSLPPKAEKYRMRSSLADSEAALPPSKRLHRALEAMTACAAEAAEEEETAKGLKTEETHGLISQKSDSTNENTRASDGADKVIVKNCLVDDADKIQDITVISKDFVDKEVDPVSVGLCNEDPQHSEAAQPLDTAMSLEPDVSQELAVGPAVREVLPEVVRVEEEPTGFTELSKLSHDKVIEEKAATSNSCFGSPDMKEEAERTVETEGPSDLGQAIAGNTEDTTAISSGLSPVSMDLSEDKSDVKEGDPEFKADELQSTADNSEVKVSAPPDMNFSPVSPKAPVDDHLSYASFRADSLGPRDEPEKKIRTWSMDIPELKDGKEQVRTSPSAWWGRTSHSSKFYRSEDRRKLENHLEFSLHRKDAALAKTAFERLHETSPKVKTPPSMRYSPVSPTIREDGNKVLSDVAVDRPSRDTTVQGSKPQLDTTTISTRINRFSSKVGHPEVVSSARGFQSDKSKTSKIRRQSPIRHGADTSSLVSDRGTTESHSGESLVSESEHTSARTKPESSMRTKSGGQQDSIRLNELSLSASASRLQTDGAVNKVREAYEVAKELKQKLAKDGDASLKYLMAAVQAKQLPGSLLSAEGVGSGRSDVVSGAEHATAASKDVPLPPNTNNSHKSDGVLSDEAEEAKIVFESLLDNLSRAKDSIHCATRQAIDCAKLGLSEQVINIIARRLELEQSLSRRIDLFFLVDSITVTSHNLRGTPAGVYRSIVHNALPRLLSSAAPPGNFARENRRQCLKVFKLWHERNVFPPAVIQHFMREIELHNCDRVVMNTTRRPARNERPVDDPIREMEGMQVDEYGSNASFALPGVNLQRICDVDEEGNGGGPMASGSEDYAAVNVTPRDPVERHPRVLEEVDGELEMEDVSPETDTWQRQYVSPASILAGPPLPICPPPSPPPLPASPPPNTPPPPPPSSPPPRDAVPDSGTAYQDGFSPGYYHAQHPIPQSYNEPYEHYHSAYYGDEGYGMRADHGYGGGFSDMPHGQLSPHYGGGQYGGHAYPGDYHQVDGHGYQGDYSYHWSEPSPRSRYNMHSSDHYYNSHHDGRYVEHGPPDYYHHQNGPHSHYMPSHYEGGYHGRYSSGYMSPPPDQRIHGHANSGRSRRHEHYGYSHDYGAHDGGYSHHSHSHSHDGGSGGYSHSHSSHHDGGYSHGPYSNWH